MDNDSYIPLNTDADTDNDNTKQFRIERDGDRDLEFTGRLIGSGSHGSGGTSGYSCDWNRGTDVEIFRTKSGKYIISVRQWSRWQGENDLHRAVVCGDAPAVLAWLVEDCGGSLGPASKESFENAAEEDEALALILTETID